MTGILNESSLKFSTDVSTISKLGVEAHGISLYDKDLPE